jgi:hypothetical protein
LSLTFGFASIRDLFEKLKRDAAALDEQVTSDRLFNFAVTGYSMIDWVKNDPSVPSPAKLDVHHLYGLQWLKICGNVANGCKHFTLTTANPITTSARSASGWGCGRYGKGAWGVGEESISILLNDGTSLSGLQLVEGVLLTWEQFFTTHGI